MGKFLLWLFCMWLMVKSIKFFGKALAESEGFQAHMERKLARESIQRDIQEARRAAWKSQHVTSKGDENG